MKNRGNRFQETTSVLAPRHEETAISPLGRNQSFLRLAGRRCARSSRPRARRRRRCARSPPVTAPARRFTERPPRSASCEAGAATCSPAASARPRCAFACRHALAQRPPRSLARVLVLVLRCRVRSPCAVCCLSRALVGWNERRQRKTENERTEKGIRERKKKSIIFITRRLCRRMR